MHHYLSSLCDTWEQLLIKIYIFHSLPLALVSGSIFDHCSQLVEVSVGRTLSVCVNSYCFWWAGDTQHGGPTSVWICGNSWIWKTFWGVCGHEMCLINEKSIYLLTVLMCSTQTPLSGEKERSDEIISCYQITVWFPGNATVKSEWTTSESCSDPCTSSLITLITYCR